MLNNVENFFDSLEILFLALNIKNFFTIDFEIQLTFFSFFLCEFEKNIYIL